MKRLPTNRRRVHIDRVGKAFLPPERMAQIRWEESVLRGRLKREGVTDPVIRHGTCHCGSIACVGVPHADAEPCLRFTSERAGGTLLVAERGTVVEASVEVEHDTDGKFALRVTDPLGVVHHAVVAAEPSPYRRWMRSVAMPELAGAEVGGAWRLVVLDHALGAGEHLRAWSLAVTVRRAPA